MNARRNNRGPARSVFHLTLGVIGTGLRALTLVWAGAGLGLIWQLLDSGVPAQITRIAAATCGSLLAADAARDAAPKVYVERLAQ